MSRQVAKASALEALYGTTTGRFSDQKRALSDAMRLGQEIDRDIYKFLAELNRKGVSFMCGKKYTQLQDCIVVEDMTETEKVLFGNEKET